MEVVAVKRETIGGARRRPSALNAGPVTNAAGEVAAPGSRVIRRRRREVAAQQQQQLPAVPLLGAAGSSDVNGEVIDQSSTTGSNCGSIKRSSRFRGVSRHRWTGRFEAHLWDKGSWNATQRKKGKQVYLGAYDEEEAAARAYDLAALKYWGPSTYTNFPISDYEKEIQVMQNVTKEEYLASIRRKSSGFSRGVSKYRGVARHHHNGRWEARIGRVFGNKYLYLGTYSTQEEAAKAYDIAAIEYRGINAVTNFDLSTYIRWLKPAAASSGSGSSSSSVLYAAQLEQLHARDDLRAMPTSYAVLSSAEEPQRSQCANPFVSEYATDRLLLPACGGGGGGGGGGGVGGGASNKSSPTALGLLLKSALFRQLMESFSATSEGEGEGGDAIIYDEMASQYASCELSYEELVPQRCDAVRQATSYRGLV